MVVGCPKCKAKLNVPDERIKPEGSKFKCPKCAAVLMVKRPAATAAPRAPEPGAPAKELDRQKILVAHEDPALVEKIKSLLSRGSFQFTVPADGVDSIAKAMEEMPFLLVLDAALPQIDGFEVVRRLRDKPEMQGVKVILISSSEDGRRQQKQPAAVYGVDEYVDVETLERDLVNALYAVLGVKKKEPVHEKPAAGPAPPVTAEERGEEDEEVQRARRLARIVLSDIDLYSPDKVLEAVRTNSFQSVFAADLKEGLKHYEKKIPQGVRNRGNFFQDAIDEFVQKKRRMLGLS